MINFFKKKEFSVVVYFNRKELEFLMDRSQISNRMLIASKTEFAEMQSFLQNLKNIGRNANELKCDKNPINLNSRNIEFINYVTFSFNKPEMIETRIKHKLIKAIVNEL